MGGSGGFSSGYDHLVERVTLVKVRIKILTKLTRPAGAGIKAAYNSAINMFHGGRLLKGENTVARFVWQLRLTARMVIQSNGPSIYCAVFVL